MPRSCAAAGGHQLDRQIAFQFYERTALSKNKAAMLTRGAGAGPGDALTVHSPGPPLAAECSLP
jgi:predicted nuclease of restriction endonuclease-like (RecB) superfamily